MHTFIYTLKLLASNCHSSSAKEKWKTNAVNSENTMYPHLF